MHRMTLATSSENREALLARYHEVRSRTERLCAPLQVEDFGVQSMPDASPTKWHLAHTSWFFETFLLEPFAPGHQAYHPQYSYLFNSYYNQVGQRVARSERGLMSRPTVSEVFGYRAWVDERIGGLLLECGAGAWRLIQPRTVLGLHHEQQHQELLLTDILHAFAQNPTDPAYDVNWQPPRAPQGPSDFVDVPAGIMTIGHDGDGFCFDNEIPLHDQLIPEVRIARHLVTNAEWLAFMRAGGYATPSLWLSDGWAVVQAEGWHAPGYWRQQDDAWFLMTLGGLKAVDPAAPVMHVSYYEADAFARFAGKHLPGEAEWEVAVRAGLLADAFGIAWQWTCSAYLPYPGYRAAEGALGEYNGKFMVNQMVLRGSSLATPEGHARASYRNFFCPPARWQFSGLRLAAFD